MPISRTLHFYDHEQWIKSRASIIVAPNDTRMLVLKWDADQN